MNRSSTQVGRTMRWLRWGVVCAVVVSLGTWAPNALAEDPVGLPDGTYDLYLLPDGDRPAEAPVDKGFDRRWSLAIDPATLRAAVENPGEGGAEPAEPAQGGWCRVPLPAHNLQGVGGGLITPMAYMVNPGPPGTQVGLPSLSYTFVRMGTKSAHVMGVTETFFRRIEVGYAFLTLGLGNFPGDVRDATGGALSPGPDHVMVHYFNLRGMVIEETPTIPAVTAGVTFMYNPNIQTINRRLANLPRGLGLERSNGTDFTLTSTKTFPTLFFGRPVMLSGGIRFSQTSQIGTLGFGDAYRMTGEGSVFAFLTDCLVLGYEYRQKKGALGRLGDLVKDEDDWHTVIVAFCVSPQCCIAVGWGHFGNVANSDENGVWGFQVKYDF